MPISFCFFCIRWLAGFFWNMLILDPGGRGAVFLCACFPMLCIPSACPFLATATAPSPLLPLFVSLLCSVTLVPQPAANTRFQCMRVLINPKLHEPQSPIAVGMNPCVLVWCRNVPLNTLASLYPSFCFNQLKLKFFEGKCCLIFQCLMFCLSVVVCSILSAALCLSV
jgi:hypothetical protein